MIYFSRKSQRKIPKLMKKKRKNRRLKRIRDILNRSNLYEDFRYILTAGEIPKFINATITSRDVERIFGKYKNILRSFIFEKFKHHIVVSYNAFE